MLNLYSCIHFHKIEIHIFINKEFQGSNTVVSYSLCKFCRKFSHFFSCFCIYSCRRSFFYQFLMSSLNGTVPFSKVNCISKLISYNLYFNVSWFFNIFFNIYIRISKSRFCFILCRNIVFYKFFFIVGNSHSFSTTTGSSFYHNRISYPFCNLLSFFNIRNYTI